MKRSGRGLVGVAIAGAWLLTRAVAAQTAPAASAAPAPVNAAPINAALGLRGAPQSRPLAFADGRILQATGFGNTFLVQTGDGVVIIDTSNAAAARGHHGLLRPLGRGPVRAIILTHAHGDHTGGIGLWREPGAKVVAQQNHVAFMNYQTRLAGFFQRRNGAQYATGRSQDGGANPGNYAAKIEPDMLFDKETRLEIGGLTFQVVAAPGETPDHAFVYVPQLKAVFIGDNYYASFPNLYTLRGTEPRPALNYVESIDKVLALRPEIVLPSHGVPIVGADKVQTTLRQYRDAILYVHDATVKGMNEGRDVYSLMREIKLPPALALPEGYGAIAWSVRGIYEGYAGWFDEDPATMYALSPLDAGRELTALAGGAGPVAARAEALTAAGRPELALRLTSAALAADPGNPAALTARKRALEVLLARSANSNETGWLRAGLAEVEAARR